MRIFILILEPSVAQWAACQISLSNECNKLSVIVCEVVSFLVHGFSICTCHVLHYKTGIRKRTEVSKTPVPDPGGKWWVLAQ